MWQEIQSTSQMVDTMGGEDKYLILFVGEGNWHYRKRVATKVGGRKVRKA